MILNEVQHIEDVVITDNKIKKCCYFSLELIKLGIQYIKNKNVNININAKKKNKNNKTGLSVSSTDEDSGEIVKETSVIELSCPVCKKMLEMKNEIEIQKKGNCKCSCIPTSFKLSKNDKRMNVEKTKDSINLETDVHNITFKWGKDASLSENGDNETQETIKQMMKN